MAHSDRAHARLSASGSSRWLNCTPSVKLEEQFLEQTSPFAMEGTLAHEIAEVLLRYELNFITEERKNEALKELQNHELYSKEMPGQVQKYVTFCLERYSHSSQYLHGPDYVQIEERFDFSHIVPDGFGTGDFTIIADGTLYIIDLKYGKGVRVEAENNSQLRLYALGALNEYDMLYHIEYVKMIVVQPRLDHISEEMLPVNELEDWGQNYVKPRAELAMSGKGETVAGKHCKFCRAKAKCRAFQQHVNVHAAEDFKEPQLLEDDELIAWYEKLPAFKDYYKAVGEYVLEIALKGKQIPGYKVVESRTNRKWIDPEEALEVLRKAGFSEEEITNVKIKGIGDISDLMPKDDFEKLLHSQIVKPPGKPVLVPETDKRKLYDKIEEAKKDFE